MGSIHIPRLAGRRRAGPRTGRRARIGVALALLGAMGLVAGAQHAASAAADARLASGTALIPFLVLLFPFPPAGDLIQVLD